MCGQAHLSYTRKQLAERRIPREICPQDKCVDKKSYEGFCVALFASGQRRADADVFLSTVTTEQNLVCSERGHEKRHALTSGQSSDLLCQLAGKLRLYSGSPMTAYSSSRVVCWQL